MNALDFVISGWEPSVITKGRCPFLSWVTEKTRGDDPDSSGRIRPVATRPWSQPVRGRGDDEVTQRTESEQSRSPVFQFIFLQIPRSSRYFVINLSEGPPVQLSGCTGEYVFSSDVVRSLGTGSPSSRWLGDLCSPVTTPPWHMPCLRPAHLVCVF